MKKMFLSVLVLALAIPALAETDYIVKRDVEILQQDLDRAEIAIDAVEAGTSISLASNLLFIGSYDGVATPRAVSGVISVTPSGKVSFVSGAISNAAVATNASISQSKLATLAITSALITDGTISNADIAASAAIDQSKLATLAITYANISGAVTTNQPFLSATGVTNTLVISNGLIVAIQ